MTPSSLKTSMKALVVASFLSLTLADPIALTVANFDTATKNKAGFLMLFDGTSVTEDFAFFFEVWSDLATEWEGHEHGIIGTVDCGNTEETRDICEYFGDDGEYPLLVWGGSESWEAYYGEFDPESLSAFAKENISKPICSAYALEHCDEATTTMINGYLSMPEEDLLTKYSDARAALTDAVMKYEKKLEDLFEERDYVAGEVNANIDKHISKFSYTFVEQEVRRRGLKIPSQVPES